LQRLQSSARRHNRLRRLFSPKSSEIVLRITGRIFSNHPISERLPKLARYRTDKSFRHAFGTAGSTPYQYSSRTVAALQGTHSPAGQGHTRRDRPSEPSAPPRTSDTLSSLKKEHGSPLRHRSGLQHAVQHVPPRHARRRLRHERRRLRAEGCTPGRHVRLSVCCSDASSSGAAASTTIASAARTADLRELAVARREHRAGQPAANGRRHGLCLTSSGIAGPAQAGTSGYLGALP